MGRPTNNQGFFCNAESLFDSQPKDNFEKIAIHVFLGDALEDGFIIKQVGYNKYVVSNNDGSRTGIVTLVKRADATKVGTGYIIATDAQAQAHSVLKLMKNKVIAYVDEDNSDAVDVYTFNYNSMLDQDGVLKASFEPVSPAVQVVLETVN